MNYSLAVVSINNLELIKQQYEKNTFFIIVNYLLLI